MQFFCPKKNLKKGTKTCEFGCIPLSKKPKNRLKIGFFI